MEQYRESGKESMRDDDFRENARHFTLCCFDGLSQLRDFFEISNKSIFLKKYQQVVENLN